MNALQDHDKILALFKQHFGITLESKEVSFKGWNWGQTDFQGMCNCDIHMFSV
jgi:structure-specific recognition protein 1